MLTLYSFKKTVLFSAQVEYSNFSVVYRPKIFFYYSTKKREFIMIYTEYIKRKRKVPCTDSADSLIRSLSFKNTSF